MGKTSARVAVAVLVGSFGSTIACSSDSGSGGSGAVGGQGATGSAPSTGGVSAGGTGSGGAGGGFGGSGGLTSGGGGTSSGGTGGTASGGGGSGPSCSGYCGTSNPVPGSNPKCYCDTGCKQYSDCCADYDALCGGNTGGTSSGGTGGTTSGGTGGTTSGGTGGTSTGGTNSGGTGGACVPNCTGLACGPDPVCGTSCGTCTGAQEQCVSGKCECQPSCSSCAGKLCPSGSAGCGQTVCTPTGGTDGCGKTCSSCQCPTAQCSPEGKIECAANDTTFMNYRICQSGKWVNATCPKYNACDQNVCRPMCDGMLSSSTTPRVCAAPFIDLSGKQWIIFDSNNLTKLPYSALKAEVVNAAQQAIAVKPFGSTSWPYSVTLGFPNEYAILHMQLSKFTNPLTRVTGYARVRRLSTTIEIPALYIGFFNGSTVFASGKSGLLGSTWSTESVYITSTYTKNYNHSAGAWSTVFFGVAQPMSGPALLDLNWFLAEIQQ